MPWEVTIRQKPDNPDLEARRVRAAIADMGVNAQLLSTARGYLIEGGLDSKQIERIASQLLVDPVIEEFSLQEFGDDTTAAQTASGDQKASQPLVQVLLKPGVTDPVAASTERAITDMGLRADTVRTVRKYWFAEDTSSDALRLVAEKVLANDSIEQIVFGALATGHLGLGKPYRVQLITVPLRDMDDPALERLSFEGQLFLSLDEMRTLRGYFRDLGRDPTDVELETLAQTWSEHCSHKTLRGRIRYRDERGERQFKNLLKETVFAATEEVREKLGDDDWCVSVFEDNAGIVRFDEANNVCFKVETHNHPSALEPYGGANTGVGGVIRDCLGTGLGARPVCNTDVFCFAPPETPHEALPRGVLHPKRIMQGVVAGVRDYGNRMGIPTVNGAVYFDERYVANPLVYCGTVGIIPADKCCKAPQSGDLVVAIGGRTGRDGIHGATFSSAELTHESEDLSGGAVQIGNAITEKMLLDVLLEARDRGLFTAVTDCGAGGFSSAVGEMGAELGAEVWLERAPLKYRGLSYTEIWISEAQERMVLAVPPSKWDELRTLCESEDVEATVIGKFTDDGRLLLKYDDHLVGELDMQFLHEGRPPVVRSAVYTPSEQPQFAPPEEPDYTDALKKILASLNVCSKEWVIRQYDHEVQGGSVVKPLVGICNDGPSDAAVVRPVLDSPRGLVIACGMNPRYGDLDPYWMAASAIDEAVRNCVAVGADPDRVALLDNFCWANTDRPEVLGSLVRAAMACRDVAVAYRTPFISGKDSLNNEYIKRAPAGRDNGGRAKGGDLVRIAIPPTLLISALGQVDDARQCVTMDLKEPGNLLLLVGETKSELGGSHYGLVHGIEGGQVPQVDTHQAREIFRRVHEAIRHGFVRSCHDLSEGGLAVALAEMAFAGGLGARVSLPAGDLSANEGSGSAGTIPLCTQRIAWLFSESNSRFLIEVAPQHEAELTRLFDRSQSSSGASQKIPYYRLGQVTDDGELTVRDAAGGDRAVRGDVLIRESVGILKECWQRPLRW